MKGRLSRYNMPCFARRKAAFCNMLRLNALRGLWLMGAPPVPVMGVKPRLRFDIKTSYVARRPLPYVVILT